MNRSSLWVVAAAAWISTSACTRGRCCPPATPLPVAGTAHGVHTTGLRYPLLGEDLLPGSTRGVSNELLGAEATVSVGDGVLLAVQPHALEPDADAGDAGAPDAGEEV